MSDLIKREDVLKVIHDYFKEFLDYIEEQEKGKENYSDDISVVLDENKNLCTKIKEIPVAYDVEQVVKELEEESRLAEKEMEHARANNPLQYERSDSYLNAIHNALEIIKEVGGMNEHTKRF